MRSLLLRTVEGEAAWRDCPELGAADDRYQLSDVLAEALSDPARRAVCVLDVVEQGRTDHGRRHADVGDDGNDGETVGDVRVSVAAGLLFMRTGCLLVSTLNGGDGGWGWCVRTVARTSTSDGMVPRRRRCWGYNRRRAFMTLPRRLPDGRRPTPEQAVCGRGTRGRGHCAPVRRHLG